MDIDLVDALDLETLGELQDAHEDMLAGLRDARLRAGLSQEELAEKLGWSVQAVQDFEGPFADPHMSSVRRYAMAVGSCIRYTVRAVEGAAPIAEGHRRTPNA